MLDIKCIYLYSIAQKSRRHVHSKNRTEHSLLQYLYLPCWMYFVPSRIAIRETKVLNDLDEKIHAIGKMMIHRPELIKILNKNQTNQSPELVFPSITIWYIFGEKFHKWQERKKEQKHV